MKRLLICFMALCLMGVGIAPYHYVRLTVINKSDMPVAVELNGKDLEQFYYLKLVEGSRSAPTVTEFTVVRDMYSMKVYYIETYDPIYPYKCGTTSGGTLDATHKIRLTLVGCGEHAPRGEPSMQKLPEAGRSRWRPR